MPFFWLFGSIMLSATAYLQTNAKWWKGVAASAGLLAVGFTMAMQLSLGIDLSQIKTPAAGLAIGAIMSGGIVGLGVIISLALRHRYEAKKIAMAAFFLGVLLFGIAPWIYFLM